MGLIITRVRRVAARNIFDHRDISMEITSTSYPSAFTVNSSSSNYWKWYLVGGIVNVMLVCYNISYLYLVPKVFEL